MAEIKEGCAVKVLPTETRDFVRGLTGYIPRGHSRETTLEDGFLVMFDASRHETPCAGVHKDNLEVVDLEQVVREKIANAILNKSVVPPNDLLKYAEIFWPNTPSHGYRNFIIS